MKIFQIIGLAILFFLVLILMETTVVNFPFTFLVAVILVVFFKKKITYGTSFILGFSIDSLRVSDFGLTGFFIFGTAFVIFLYEKYLGSDDIVINSFIIGVVTLIYSYFLGYSIGLVLLFFGIVILGWYIVMQLKKKGKIYI